jgi:hypothetical protein
MSGSTIDDIDSPDMSNEGREKWLRAVFIPLLYSKEKNYSSYVIGLSIFWGARI